MVATRIKSPREVPITLDKRNTPHTSCNMRAFALFVIYAETIFSWYPGKLELTPERYLRAIYLYPKFRSLHNTAVISENLFILRSKCIWLTVSCTDHFTFNSQLPGKLDFNARTLYLRARNGFKVDITPRSIAKVCSLMTNVTIVDSL